MSLWNKVIPDSNWRVAPWSVTNCSAGPYQHGTDLYVVSENIAGTQLGAFKSTDSGATWALVGTGPTTAPFSNDIRGGDNGFACFYCCDVDGATIYVAYWSTLTSADPVFTGTLAFITFDMGADSWGSPATGPNISVFDDLSLRSLPIGIHFRPSDGNLVLCGQKIVGSAHYQSYFLVYDPSGTVLVSETMMVDNDGHLVSFRIVDVYLRTCLSKSGDSYWINCFFCNVIEIVHCSIDDSNSVGTVQTLATLGMSPIDFSGPEGPGSTPPQYLEVNEIPYAIGDDIIFPFLITTDGTPTNNCIFRATAATNPTWTFSDLTATIPAFLDGSAVKNTVACVDASGKPSILVVLNVSIWQTTWSSSAWTSLVKLAVSDIVDDLLFFLGSSSSNYFSTRVVLSQLDAVWGFGLDFGPGNELRTATTIHLGPTPPPPGSFGNVFGSVSFTQSTANIFI